MTIYISESFTGTNGAAPNASVWGVFTAAGSGIGPTVTIQNNKLQCQPGTSAAYDAEVTAYTLTNTFRNIEVRGELQLPLAPGNDAHASVWLRDNAAGDPTGTGYEYGFNPAVGGLYITRASSFTYTDLVTQAFSFTSDVYGFAVQIRDFGAHVQCRMKLWSITAGQSEQNDAWAITGYDTSPVGNTGNIHLYAKSGGVASGYALYDSIVIQDPTPDPAYVIRSVGPLAGVGPWIPQGFQPYDFTLPPGPSGVTGDASLSVTASLSSDSVVGVNADAALTPTAGLAASANVGTSGGAVLAATAGLTATAVVGIVHTASLSATAGLTATATRTAGANLAATAGLTASAVVGRVGAATLGAVANLTAGTGVASTAALSASAGLSAIASVQVLGTATLAAVSGFTAGAQVGVVHTASLAATTSMVATATVVSGVIGQASLNATAGFTATANLGKVGSAQLSVVAGMSATATKAGSSVAALASVAAMTASAVVGKRVSASLAVVGGFSASGLIPAPVTFGTAVADVTVSSHGTSSVVTTANGTANIDIDSGPRGEVN